MEAEAPAVQTLRDWPGDSTASCGHGGATRWGQETGLYRGLRAEDSESETGQMAEVRVQRGQQAGAAGVPGQSRAQDPGGVCDRGRTAAARRRLHSRRQAQGGVLREADGGSAQSAVHEGGPGVRGPVLRSAGAVFRSGWGGECVLMIVWCFLQQFLHRRWTTLTLLAAPVEQTHVVSQVELQKGAALCLHFTTFLSES